ncbi:MAG TPA: hypothetical protein ENF53_02795 [Thermoprotei archaeon]|nr:hypothetical protein [Thermoprotei archaeon]
MGYRYGWGRGRGRGMGWETAQNFPQLPPPVGVRYAAAVDTNAGLDSIISIRAGRAPFVAFIDISGNKVVNVAVHPNPAAVAPGGAGVMLGQWLISSGVRVFFASRIGPNIGMVLNQAGVRVEIVPPGTRIRDILARLGIIA